MKKSIVALALAALSVSALVADVRADDCGQGAEHGNGENGQGKWVPAGRSLYRDHR